MKIQKHLGNYTVDSCETQIEMTRILIYQNLTERCGLVLSFENLRMKTKWPQQLLRFVKHLTNLWKYKSIGEYTVASRETQIEMLRRLPKWFLYLPILFICFYQITNSPRLSPKFFKHITNSLFSYFPCQTDYVTTIQL